ncbi:MAG: DUF1801 domain-containing protein [Planctomycetota bacterium]
MQSKAATVKQYLAELPEDRREMIEAIRAVILRNLPKGYEEQMQYGMIGYVVPHSVYPAGYHCDATQPVPFINLGNQKGHVGLYMFCLYCEPGWQEEFVEAWKATGNRLDMGKACIRIKKLEQVPLPLIGRTVKKMTVKKFLASYTGSFGPSGKPASTKKTAKKAMKKSASKKTASKKAAKKTAKKAAGRSRA